MIRVVITPQSEAERKFVKGYNPGDYLSLDGSEFRVKSVENSIHEPEVTLTLIDPTEQNGYEHDTTYSLLRA